MDHWTQSWPRAQLDGFALYAPDSAKASQGLPVQKGVFEVLAVRDGQERKVALIRDKEGQACPLFIDASTLPEAESRAVCEQLQPGFEPRKLVWVADPRSW